MDSDLKQKTKKLIELIKDKEVKEENLIKYIKENQAIINNSIVLILCLYSKAYTMEYFHIYFSD